jgi:hypothetical protein
MAIRDPNTMQCAMHGIEYPRGGSCAACAECAANGCHECAARARPSTMITIVPWQVETTRMRELQARELLNKALGAGTVRTHEEHQADFEGEEEPTDARAQRFNREWHEAQHTQDQERIQALEGEINTLRRRLEQGYSYCERWHMPIVTERDELKAQLERVLKDRQPQLRSERRVLVDIDE